jgi:hypothetical protein
MADAASPAAAGSARPEARNPRREEEVLIGIQYSNSRRTELIYDSPARGPKRGGRASGYLWAPRTEERSLDVEIEKTFKSKLPLTICRLTQQGKAAFAGYSRRTVGILQATHPGKR